MDLQFHLETFEFVMILSFMWTRWCNATWIAVNLASPHRHLVSSPDPT